MLDTLEDLYAEANRENGSFFKWWTSFDGGIELVIDIRDAKKVARPGDALEDVRELRAKPYIQMQTQALTLEQINKAISEYDKNPSTDPLDFLIWTACCDLVDV